MYVCVYVYINLYIYIYVRMFYVFVYKCICMYIRVFALCGPSGFHHSLYRGSMSSFNFAMSADGIGIDTHYGLWAPLATWLWLQPRKRNNQGLLIHGLTLPKIHRFIIFSCEMSICRTYWVGKGWRIKTCKSGLTGLWKIGMPQTLIMSSKPREAKASLPKPMLSSPPLCPLPLPFPLPSLDSLPSPFPRVMSSPPKQQNRRGMKYMKWLLRISWNIMKLYSQVFQTIGNLDITWHKGIPSVPNLLHAVASGPVYSLLCQHSTRSKSQP